eukprot:TRINITY_DN360_c0_g4_i1.p1 TRINITY_DN360_c0_g4~~TRINITY_DN360_c0_g4_i1.p1  ORF type:complete len:291 (+),score=108.62 TRINITY_DN360_c0_g4_i1:65-874(+)
MAEGALGAVVGGTRLLLVRHAESQNNVTLERLRAKNLPDFEDVWMRSREDDPPCSGRGVEEAEALAKYLAPVLGREPRVVVYTSPLLRCLQTAAPLCREMGLRAAVRPDLYENGGVYTVAQDAAGKTIRSGPGRSMSRSEIGERFPSFDVSALPAQGPWYRGGWENDTQAYRRAEELVRWMRSDEVREAVGAGIGVIVCHGAIINNILQVLACVEWRAEWDDGRTNAFPAHGGFMSRNTSLSLLSFAPDRKRTCRIMSVGSRPHLSSSL